MARKALSSEHRFVAVAGIVSTVKYHGDISKCYSWRCSKNGGGGGENDDDNDDGDADDDDGRGD